MIARLPILLAQLKAGNNSQKFMNTLNSKTNESNRFIYQFTATLTPAHLFVIRGRRKRDPRTLHTRDQNLPK